MRIERSALVRGSAASALVVGLLVACSDDASSGSGATDAGSTFVADASSSSDGAASADAAVGPSCDSVGVSLCGGACINTLTNPLHCGACDKVCAAGEACQSGACVAQCQIDGKSYAEGTINPANSCEQCVPATSVNGWTTRVDGTLCNPGQLCGAGKCAPRCFIGNALHDAGAVNPDDVCEVCTPATSLSSWTKRGDVDLFVGGTTLESQGWSKTEMAPATVSYGADYVRLQTSTSAGVGGMLLVSKAGVYTSGKPFAIRVTMLVESVNAHNAFDAAAAILGSYGGGFGVGTDRSQMVYLDSAAIGWADDSQSAAFAVTDGMYHVYDLSVDAAKVATLSVDGVAKLTRNNYTGTGAIAIGDQTNDPNVDGTVRIKAVKRICP